MIVIVFISNIENLVNYTRYLPDASCSSLEYIFITTSNLNVQENCEASLLNLNIYEEDTLNDALSVASELIIDSKDTFISLDTVIAVEGFEKQIEKIKKVIPSIKVAFGRWYKESIDKRYSAKLLGTKYLDSIPGIIAPNIIDHTPSFEVHSKRVNEFPIFFNWFSKSKSDVLKEALLQSTTFTEFSNFMSNFLNYMDSNSSILYCPDIEVIDIDLLC